MDEFPLTSILGVTVSVDKAGEAVVNVTANVAQAVAACATTLVGWFQALLPKIPAWGGIEAGAR